MERKEPLFTGVQVSYSINITAKDTAGRLLCFYSANHSLSATSENIEAVRGEIRTSLMGCMEVAEQMGDYSQQFR